VTPGRVARAWACGVHTPEEHGVVCGACHLAEIAVLVDALDQATRKAYQRDALPGRALVEKYRARTP
jgi:hypothetical protein